jgi:DNA ligase (NAD+)
VQQRIELFVSRGAMDIRGIGESQSAMLFEEGLVKNVADLYDLKNKRERLLNIERMAELSVDNMLAAIEKSKDRPLARVIFALGIRHVGSETAEILAQRFHGIEALAQASREGLMEIDAIGPKIADSIIAFFHEETNRKIIDRLREAGVTLQEETKLEKLPLSGQEFVITGRLEAFSRQEAENRIKALGGTAKDNVTQKTTCLVVGADPGGNKLSKAQELGTRQIDEKELLRILGQK